MERGVTKLVEVIPLLKAPLLKDLACQNAAVLSRHMDGVVAKRIQVKNIQPLDAEDDLNDVLIARNDCPKEATRRY